MLLICVATAPEASLLRAQLPADGSVRILEMGVGPVNAAHAVTVAIIHNHPTAIVVCGIGGAYPGSGLSVGDVACAGVESYGDLGAESPAGFLDMKALGFPVVAAAPPLYDELPMQLFPAQRRVKFVTVSMCTGTAASARAIEARTGGAVENMEGAAVAHVALLHGVPCGELRGISNIVTDRDRGSWRLKEASEAAQRSLLDWLQQR
jgi:futalosine hydrolase